MWHMEIGDAVAGVISVAAIILVFGIWFKLRSLQKKYNDMMGKSGVTNLQDVMIELQQKINSLQESYSEHNRTIRYILDRLGEMKGNIAIQRYNAFGDHGSDLSFSIAIVDDSLNGVVFTGIHGREESYTYGKPLERGESKYSLSPEERKAISLAQSKSNNRV